MASGTVLQSTNNSTMTLRYSGTDGQAKVIEVPSTSGTMATEEKSLITLGTAQATTSGTFIDFTIPSGAKRITVMFDGVSTSGASLIQVQLGDSGGIENTGYTAFSKESSTTGIIASSGFIINSASASNIIVGNVEFSMASINKFITSYSVCFSQAGVSYSISGSGSKTLSAELTTVRITTVNGTDLFDAGIVNVSWEY